MTKSTLQTSNQAEVDIEFEFTEGFAHKFIRYKTRQLIGRFGIQRSDRDDLCQDLKFRLLRRLPQFDPKKSDWPAFVTTVVERHIATIIEYRRRLKRRGCGQEVSLAELVSEEDGLQITLEDCVLTEDLSRMSHEFHRPDPDWVELEHDLAATISQFPPELQEILERLQTEPIARVARDLGVPRSTLMSQLRRLRPVLAAQGLDEFLR